MASTWHERFQAAKAERDAAAEAHDQAYADLIAKANAYYEGHGPRISEEDGAAYVASGRRLTNAEGELYDKVMSE